MKSELHKKIREENYAIRFLVYIVGLFIMTLGISLSVKSNLGVSPVSSIPYTITCITGLEMGKATILFHIVLVVMQILILRKAFQMKNLLQVVVGVIFGYFTTFSNYLFSFLPTPEHMTVRLLMMLGSTVLIAVGIFFYLPADIVPLAGEGAMKAVSDTTHIAFNKVKVGFDISMVMSHGGKKSFSDIHTLGALSGNSKKSFRGTLDFLHGATASEGAEEDTCLLLDPTVKSVSLPLLLCKEDNVVGNHAASAGQIDHNKLFYIMSRGFSEVEAKHIIVESMIRPIIDRIGDETIEEAALAAVRNKI